MSTNVGSVTKFFPTAQNGFVTTLASTIASGAATVPLNSVAGYTNGDTAVFIVDPTSATLKQTFTGVIDTAGVQVTGVVWTAGPNQAHTGGATVVDYMTATHQNMMTKGILVNHNSDGTHIANLPLTTPKITTGVKDSNGVVILGLGATASAVNDLTLSNATAGNAPGLASEGADANIDLKLTPKGTGKVVVPAGTLAGAALVNDSVTPAKMLGIDLFGVGAALVGSAPAAGTGQFYIQTGTVVITAVTTITFPTAFPNGTVTVLATNGDGVASNGTITTSSATASSFSVASTIGGSTRINWLAIGF